MTDADSAACTSLKKTFAICYFLQASIWISCEQHLNTSEHLYKIVDSWKRLSSDDANFNLNISTKQR